MDEMGERERRRKGGREGRSRVGRGEAVKGKGTIGQRRRDLGP